jgi:hypothetical protein
MKNKFGELGLVGIEAAKINILCKWIVKAI